MIKILVVEEFDPEPNMRDIADSHFVFKYVNGNTVQIVKNLDENTGHISARYWGRWVNEKIDNLAETYRRRAMRAADSITPYSEREQRDNALNAFNDPWANRTSDMYDEVTSEVTNEVTSNTFDEIAELQEEEVILVGDRVSFPEVDGSTSYGTIESIEGDEATVEFDGCPDVFVVYLIDLMKTDQEAEEITPIERESNLDGIEI
jgi:hypothetical protein